MNLNLLSLLSQEKLTNNRTQLENSLNKLSSGLAINKASDNSSGLSISDKLRTQSSSIKQSISNANSAVAMLQIADKAMAEISNIHDIIKQKLIQASTSTTSEEGRKAIKKDINRYIEQIDNIISQTNYNKIPLLCHNGLDFQIGENSNNIINLESINLSGDCLLNNGSIETSIETSYEAQNFELVRSGWNGSDAIAGRFVQSFGVSFSKYLSTDITNNDLLVPNNNSIVGNRLTIRTSAKSTLDISININSEKYINQDNLFAISTGATLIFKAKDASTKNYFERMMQENPYNITYDSATNVYRATTGSYAPLNESFFKTPSLATNETLNFYLSSENAYIVIRNADINSISIASDGLAGMYDYDNSERISSVKMGYSYEYDKNDDLIPNTTYTSGEAVQSGRLMYGESITSSGTDYSKVVSNTLTIDNSVRQEFNITINTKNFTDNNQFFNIQNSRQTLDMLVIEPLDENTKQYFDAYFKMYDTLSAHYIYREDLNWYGIDPRDTNFPDKMNLAYFNPSLMMEQTLHFNIINTSNNGPSNALYMNNFIPNEIKISDKQLQVPSESIFQLIPTDNSIQTNGLDFYNHFDTNYDPQNSYSITLSYENLHELSIDSFSQKVANNYLCLPDKLLNELNVFRSNVGSTQNQIESATRNLMTQYTNIKSAESVIRDVDYANETANFSKLNIIEQSAIYSQSKIKDRQDDLINIISSSDSK